MLSRVLQGSAADVSYTFRDKAGTATAVNDASVRIVREDGTELVAPTAPVADADGLFTYTLTPAETGALDVLSVEWTATVDTYEQTATTYVEVVGGFLFSVTDARALSPLNNTTTYTTARLIEYRTIAEMALEDACGVSFVPRYFRERVDGSGTVDVLLSKPRPLSVSSVVVGGTTSSVGTAFTANQLTDLRLYPTGKLYHSSGWTEGRGNVLVKGTAGYPHPPPRVGRAALLLAKRFLVDSPISDRAISTTNDDGQVSFFVTAGVRDAVFDVPECNSVISSYGMGGAVG